MKKIILTLLLCRVFCTGTVMAQYTTMSSAPDMNDYKNGINDGQYVRDKWAYDKAWKDMQQFTAMGMEITNLVALDQIRRSYTPKMNALVQNHKVSFTPSFKFTRGDNVFIAQNAKTTGQYDNNQLFSIQVNTQLAFFTYYESTPNSGLEYHDLASIAAYYLYKNYYYWQGQNVNPNTSILQKVYEQVRKKFLETPAIAGMNNRQKQEFAETMLYRTSCATDDHDGGTKNIPLKNQRALDNLKHIYGDKGIQLKITDSGIVFDKNTKQGITNGDNIPGIAAQVNISKIKADPRTVYSPVNRRVLIEEKKKNGLSAMDEMLLISRMSTAYNAYQQVMQTDLENFNDVAGAFTYIICLNYIYYYGVNEIPTPHVAQVYKQVADMILKDASFAQKSDIQKQFITETILLDAMETVDAINLNDSNRLKQTCLQYLKKYLGNKAGNLRIDTNGMNF